jgi:hypothetical protein
MTKIVGCGLDAGVGGEGADDVAQPPVAEPFTVPALEPMPC